MSRRTLWTVTALACTAIVVLGTPGLRPGLGRAAVALSAPLLGLTWMMWLTAVGLTALVTLLAWAGLRLREDQRRRVRALARRGGTAATIARRTGLAQDAVRDLLAVHAGERAR